MDDRTPRRLVLVCGDQARAEAWVVRQLTGDQVAAALWIAESAPAGLHAIPAARVSQYLGAEYPLLVFNAHQGFHPDAFAAATGTLRGGGDCVVLAPVLDDWMYFADPDKARFACYPRDPAQMPGNFLERLARIWRNHPAVRVLGPDSALRLRLSRAANRRFELTPGQASVVVAIERVAHGHARRPLVLTADRGRGKSTALGVAAARLLAAGLARVTVVAPGRASVDTLFRHAQASAGLDVRGVNDTVIGAGMLCFRLPSEYLAQTGDDPGLVMVDEAAAVPVAILNSLLVHSNRLVFASTVHGYEGSGRGFELRFQERLDAVMPQWRGMCLSEPVRWPAGDPLEALVDTSFLLDAELEDIDPDAALSLDRVEPAQLLADEPLFRATFGLLVSAHYQTRPSDLRQLLDNPDIDLCLARVGGAVAGVVMAAREGAIDAEMAERVLSGERRPRGHLLPQSLAVHAGLDTVLQLSTLRIQRIAVHPRLRRRGIGQQLVQALARRAAARGCDLLGTVYGLDRSLLAFWQAVGFVPVRLGVRVDQASAAHSLFMLRGLSAAGRGLVSTGQREFLAALPWSLAASFKDIDSALGTELLRGRDCDDLPVSGPDGTALQRIITGARQSATADALVWRALVRLAADGTVQPERLAPLVAWRLQGHSAGDVCRSFSIAGHKALEALLRSVLGG